MAIKKHAPLILATIAGILISVLVFVGLCIYTSQRQDSSQQNILAEASAILEDYKGIECPSNFSVYLLRADDGPLYKLQTKTACHHYDCTTFLLSCSIQPAAAGAPGGRPGGGPGEQALRGGHRGVLDTACGLLEYADAAVWADEGNDVTSLEPSGTNTSSVNQHSAAMAFMRGIYPGTKWCGFGNIADDLYNNLGEHADVDACCRAHDTCKPIIRSRETRYGQTNPSSITRAHCSCDIALYNCFKSINSTSAREIGRIFFNMVQIECFDFDYIPVCNWRVFGYCVMGHSMKCTAIVRANKKF